MKKRIASFMLSSFLLVLVLGVTAFADQLTMQEGANIDLSVTPGPNSTITISSIDTNTDEKVKVSNSDTADYLENQIVGGAGVTVNSDGNQITIAAPPVNVEDSADGVEVTFAGLGEYDPGTGFVPALDLNGTGLVVGGTNPDVTVGGITSTVLASTSSPQQVIVRVPQGLNAGSYKLKVKNANGFSEGLIPLQQTLFDGSTWTEATSAAAWSGRNSHTSLVYDNKMWILGGSDGVNNLNDVWYSTDGVTWAQATPNAPWTGRIKPTSLVYDNKMWILGGNDGVNVLNDVWSSTDGITWVQATASAAWPPRSAHTSLVYDNKMWVIGGIDSGPKNDVWYSTDGINWTVATTSTLWSSRFYHASIVFDNKMWVIGGNDNVDKNDVWSSTNGVTWTQATPSAAWSTRNGHISLAYNNKIWVIDGFSKNDIWSSNDGIAWNQVLSSTPWSPRNNTTGVVYDSKIWIMGGSSTPMKNDIWHTSN